MNNKKSVIVIGITSNWVFAAATVLFGLRDYLNCDEYDVLIYHDNLSEGNQDRLKRILDCRFMQYDIDLIKSNRFKRVSRLAFSRFECFGLLDEYTNVVWLDADILIKGEINNLIKCCNTGFAMFPHENTPISVSFSSSVPGFDMNAQCYNDGVFVLTDCIRHDPQQLRNWCYEKTNQFSDHINSDQAIVNLLLQAFEIQVSPLDIKYNCHPGTQCEEVSILHPWGEGKFWNQYWEPAWDGYYQKWLAMGGALCPGYQDFRKRQLGLRGLVGKIKDRLSNVQLPF